MTAGGHDLNHIERTDDDDLVVVCECGWISSPSRDAVVLGVSLRYHLDVVDRR